MVGAFLSLKVATTIVKGIVDSHVITVETVLAGLVGAIVWNLLAWLLRLPSSSTHALIGGLVGAAIISGGWHAVRYAGLISTAVAFAAAACATFLADRITAVPLWVMLSCGLAIELGAYFGAWRVIRTLGKGLTDISSTQGFTAECGSSAVMLGSSHFGFPLSTTHVVSGSVIGVGAGRKSARVRWSVAGTMVAVMTGGLAGAGVVVVAVAAVALAIYLISRPTEVTPETLNDEVPSRAVLTIRGATGQSGQPGGGVMARLLLASSSAIEWPAVVTPAGLSMVMGVVVVCIYSAGVVGAGQFLARRRGRNGPLDLVPAVVAFARRFCGRRNLPPHRQDEQLRVSYSPCRHSGRLRKSPPHPRWYHRFS